MTTKSVFAIVLFVLLPNPLPGQDQKQNASHRITSEDIYLFIVQDVVRQRAKGIEMAREQFPNSSRTKNVVVRLGRTPGANRARVSDPSRRPPHVTDLVPCPAAVCPPGRGEVFLSFGPPMEDGKNIRVVVTVDRPQMEGAIARNEYTYVLTKQDGDLGLVEIEAADIEEFIITDIE